MRTIWGGAAALMLLSGAAMAAPSAVTIDGKNIFPESVTSLADGTMIVGSMVTPVIYRAAPGAATAEPWIHLGGGAHPGTSWGVLADPRTHSLWACVVEHTITGGQPPPGNMRVSSLRRFDLSSGAEKARYPLPGAHNACNDMTIAPDGRTVYVSDLSNGRILRLKPGAAALEDWITAPELKGIDGIAFLGTTLYVNNVSTGHLYRIPIGADGAAGTPVDIKLSRPIEGPDGMRAWKGRLFLAENRANRVDAIAISGDSATVTLIKDGYQTATGVSPVGDTLWVEESKQIFWRDPALKNTDPNPFRIYALPMPK